jgi:hypothetical protein
VAKARYLPLEANLDQVAKLGASIVRLTATQRQVEAELHAAKVQLRGLVMPQFFEAAHGSSKPPQGVVVPGHGSAGLRVCVPQYVSRVDVKTMPPFAAECFKEHQQLRAMIKPAENGNFARLQAEVEAALEGCGEAHWASRLLPMPGFHTQRHELFSPEQNLAIDAAAPLSCRILV